ncbi:lipopolysaccharide assembly protein LapA domain-containing protein [Desulfurivibrio sp. D14AmB]|uniref:lipopolysaccharide assembly protein LapA domain-containing protein n=1 Tax=Desulfurivibrio sp. D14AmB TaxID=3374370 RepID=UPI00376ECDEA
MLADSRSKFKLLLALLLVALVAVLIIQNVEPTEVRFLFITVIMPRAALLAITLLAGIAIGILISLALSGHRSDRRLKHLEIEPPSQ